MGTIFQAYLIFLANLFLYIIFKNIINNKKNHIKSHIFFLLYYGLLRKAKNCVFLDIMLLNIIIYYCRAGIRLLVPEEDMHPRCARRRAQGGQFLHEVAGVVEMLSVAGGQEGLDTHVEADGRKRATFYRGIRQEAADLSKPFAGAG